jgi:hypothetical protein
MNSDIIHEILSYVPDSYLFQFILVNKNIYQYILERYKKYTTYFDKVYVNNEIIPSSGVNIILYKRYPHYRYGNNMFTFFKKKKKFTNKRTNIDEYHYIFKIDELSICVNVFYIYITSVFKTHIIIDYALPNSSILWSTLCKIYDNQGFVETNIEEYKSKEYTNKLLKKIFEKIEVDDKYLPIK